jgi:hypothetical protein
VGANGQNDVCRRSVRGLDFWYLLFFRKNDKSDDQHHCFSYSVDKLAAHFWLSEQALLMWNKSA